MLWKERYRLGVEEVDQQHKELFDRVSSFIKVVKSDERSWEAKIDEVKETLEFMKNYVVTHFHSEEALQKRIGFPGYEEHKAIHENFKAEISDYARRFEEEGYDEDLVQEFSGKLMAWLINHVASTDQNIADYIDRQEGGSKA